MNYPVTTSCWRCARRWLVGVLAAPIVLAVAAKAEPAMWVIRDKDSTIYLIGTVHALRDETVWDSAKVRKTMTESSELWLEVKDFDDEASITPLVVQYGIDLEKPLSTKLNAIQKGKLARVAAVYGVPLESLEPIKPWMAAVMFTVLPLQKAGYDQSAGIDGFLKAQAEKEGDKISVAENPLQPDRLTVLSQSDVKTRSKYPISAMPPGLLNSLNKDEVLDLVAFLLSGGNKEDKVFKP